MNKVLQVFLNELYMVVKRPSYILTLLLVPLVSFIVVFVASGFQQNQISPKILDDVFTSNDEIGVVGYVDFSGIIKSIPEDITDLLRFPNEEEALLALRNDQIDGYYLIMEDYLETGDIVYVNPDFNPLGGMAQSSDIQKTLTYNLLGGDEVLVSRVMRPLNLAAFTLEEEQVVGDVTPDVTITSQRDPDNMLTYFIPYGVTFLFYVIILGASTLMLNSVSGEKQNRMLEILFTSINPIDILTGKILALALVGLLQTIIWSGTGYFLFRVAGTSFDIAKEFQLSPSILIWGVVFFLLGYLVYASLMAGVGALVPKVKDAGQVTIVLILPLILPLVFISVLIQKPNGLFSSILSMFPLTAPIVMMTRLSAGEVPLWHLILSIVLLIATSFIIIRSVAGIFHAQTMLSGNKFNLKVYVLALIGKI